MPSRSFSLMEAVYAFSVGEGPAYMTPHELAGILTLSFEEARWLVEVLSEAGLLCSDGAGGTTLTKEGRELVETCMDWNRPRSRARGDTP